MKFGRDVFQVNASIDALINFRFDVDLVAAMPIMMTSFRAEKFGHLVSTHWQLARIFPTIQFPFKSIHIWSLGEVIAKNKGVPILWNTLSTKKLHFKTPSDTNLLCSVQPGFLKLREKTPSLLMLFLRINFFDRLIKLRGPTVTPLCTFTTLKKLVSVQKPGFTARLQKTKAWKPGAAAPQKDYCGSK